MKIGTDDATWTVLGPAPTGLGRRRDRSPIETEIRTILGPVLFGIEPVGSRVTCDPAPVDTDEDWLVCTAGDKAKALRAAGFTQDGSPEFYTGSDAGGFRSWRRGDVNVVTTQDKRFFDLFMTATHLAKRYNLLDKGDRIALFQAVLYGVRDDALEWPRERGTLVREIPAPKHDSDETARHRFMEPWEMALVAVLCLMLLAIAPERIGSDRPWIYNVLGIARPVPGHTPAFPHLRRSREHGLNTTTVIPMARRLTPAGSSFRVRERKAGRRGVARLAPATRSG